MQFVLGDMLTERAKDLWSRNIPFEPERGEIVDRNGVPLATNVSAPSVLVVPRQIENPSEVANELARILNMPVEKAYKHVTKKTSIERIHPEGRKISK
ncbi:Stage V sporulation protein D [Anoxybacillus sp. BCO1]|nr:Stage V sporulation protein D [Anoxybacillus sp. BCO1]